MRKSLIASLTMIASLGIFGQATVTWDGGGDGTTWEQGTNWVGDTEPAAGDIAQFNSGGSITVTGTPTNNPGKINLTSSTTLTLDLDLTISNGTGDIGIEVGSNSTLHLGTAGNNRTISIAPDATVDGISIATAGASVTIASSTTVDITQGVNGILINNATASLVNDGSLTITGVTDGIIYTTGTLTNNSSGVITVTNPTTDGINGTGASFTNAGTINVRAQDGGSGAEINGIEIESGGSLINSGTIDADGGGSATNRAIQNSGTLTNTGTITVSNGNTGAALRNFGTLNNNVGGFIDLVSVRINNNTGTLTNNGFIRSTYSAEGIFNNTGTATNNAFYSYSNGGDDMFSHNVFTDNGIDIDVASNTTFDAANSDQIADIGIDAAYTWYDDAVQTTQVATNDAAGAFHFEHQSGITGITQAFTVYGSDVSLTFSNVLPVELISFKLKEKDHRVCLVWSTASELNNEGFEVQRSTDGIDWEILSFVHGNGTTSELNNYHFDDISPTVGINYYRLKQIDFDGKFETLLTKVIEFGEGLSFATIYPNPTSDFINLNVSGQLPKSAVNIFDAQGRLMDFKIESGNQIQVGHLPTGIYLVNIQLGDSDKTFRVVKK